MDSVSELCKEQLAGWYDSIGRLRVGGALRTVPQAGSVVNFTKGTYPDEERPLQHFPELTQHLKAGVEALFARGVPYWKRGAPVIPLSKPDWSPCTPPSQGGSQHRAAHRGDRGPPPDPRRHNIAVYDFYVFDAHWGRASLRLSSYLPSAVSLQPNGYDDLERQWHHQRRAKSPWPRTPSPTDRPRASWPGPTWNPACAGSAPTGWPACPMGSPPPGARPSAATTGASRPWG